MDAMQTVSSPDEIGPGGGRRTRWSGVCLTVVPAAAALCAGLWHGPYLIDDAYITFRYAENLAVGIVALPWLVHVKITHGGIVPHAVAAKRLVHPDEPLHIKDIRTGSARRFTGRAICATL